MKAFKMKRLPFLMTLVLLLAAGCSAFSGDSSTPTPEPSPTPVVFAEETARAFLKAWAEGDYNAMYSMLALDRQATVTPDAFISRYKSTALEATVKTVKTTFISSHEEGNEAEVKFNVVFETNAVGTIQQDNTMILRREDNRWGVLWNPGLILSQMSGGGTARFYPLASARADIYDRKGRSLTAPQKQIIVEVVPVEMSASASCARAESRRGSPRPVPQPAQPRPPSSGRRRI